MGPIYILYSAVKMAREMNDLLVSEKIKSTIGSDYVPLIMYSNQSINGH